MSKNLQKSYTETIIPTVERQEPLLPFDAATTLYLPALWTFLTMKNGFLVFRNGRRAAKIMVQNQQRTHHWMGERVRVYTFLQLNLFVLLFV